MSIVSIPHFFTPCPTLGSGQSTEEVLDAADERIAYVMRVPKSGTIDKIEFFTGGTVSLNAGSVIRISLQTIVLGSGEPAGIQEQYRDIAATSLSADDWTVPGLLTDDGTDNGVKRIVTRGDVLCVVIEYETFNTSDVLDIRRNSSPSTQFVSNSFDGFPYDLFHTSGAWSLSEDPPIIALKYSDGSYGDPHAPGGHYPRLKSATFPTLGVDTTPDEIGNRFSFPFPVRVIGAWVKLSNPGTMELVLTDTDETTELEAYEITNTLRRANGGIIYFAQSHTLLKDGVYRLTVRPSLGTVIGIQHAQVEVAAHLGSVFNTNWISTSRTDAGNWSEDDTKMYWMGLIIDGLEEGSSGGGGGGGGGAGLPGRDFTRGMIT